MYLCQYIQDLWTCRRLDSFTIITSSTRSLGQDAVPGCRMPGCLSGPGSPVMPPGEDRPEPPPAPGSLGPGSLVTWLCRDGEDEPAWDRNYFFSCDVNPSVDYLDEGKQWLMLLKQDKNGGVYGL